MDMIPDRVALSAAREIVDDFAAKLRPHCERLEIAGSIRRGKEDVKDGELVAISKGDALYTVLDGLVSDGTATKALYGSSQTTRWGSNYRGVDFHGLKVEVFIATPQNWGFQYWLRTGPGDGNTAVMTMLGNQKAPIRFQDGQGWYSEHWEYNQKRKVWNAEHKYPLQLLSEEDLFAVLGLPYLPPDHRNVVKYRTLMQAKAHRWPDYGRFIVFPAGHPYRWDNGMARFESAKDKHGKLRRTDKEVEPYAWAAGKSYTDHTQWYREWIKETLRVKGGTLSMTKEQYARLRYTHYLKAIEGKSDDRSMLEREVLAELLTEMDVKRN